MRKQNFNFWKDHSTKYLEMAFRHDKRERLGHPDGYGIRTGDCGDTVEIYLYIRSRRIRSVSFNTDGCINTNACCNTVARLAEGKSVEDAWSIAPENVIDYLETLAPENYHCAELAVGALYLALSDYQGNRRDLWKKPYQRR